MSLVPYEYSKIIDYAQYLYKFLLTDFSGTIEFVVVPQSGTVVVYTNTTLTAERESLLAIRVSEFVNILVPSEIQTSKVTIHQKSAWNWFVWNKNEELSFVSTVFLPSGIDTLSIVKLNWNSIAQTSLVTAPPSANIVWNITTQMNKQSDAFTINMNQDDFVQIVPSISNTYTLTQTGVNVNTIMHTSVTIDFTSYVLGDILSVWITRKSLSPSDTVAQDIYLVDCFLEI